MPFQQRNISKLHLGRMWVRAKFLLATGVRGWLSIEMQDRIVLDVGLEVKDEEYYVRAR